jgi:short-subunit dehydrogenase
MPKNNSPNRTAKMTRVALITGATEGMGLEIAVSSLRTA